MAQVLQKDNLSARVERWAHRHRDAIKRTLIVLPVAIVGALGVKALADSRNANSTSPENTGNNKPGLPAAVVNREVNPDDEPTTIPTPTSSSTPTPSSTPIPLPTDTPQPQRATEQPAATVVKDPLAEATARITATAVATRPVISEAIRNIDLEQKTLDAITVALKEKLSPNTTFKSYNYGLMPGTNIAMRGLVASDLSSPHPFAKSIFDSMSQSSVSKNWSASDNQRYFEIGRKNLDSTGRGSIKVFDNLNGLITGLFIDIRVLDYKFDPDDTFVNKLGFVNSSVSQNFESDSGKIRLYWNKEESILIKLVTGASVGSKSNGREWDTVPSNPFDVAFGGNTRGLLAAGLNEQEIAFVRNYRLNTLK